MLSAARRHLAAAAVLAASAGLRRRALTTPHQQFGHESAPIPAPQLPRAVDWWQKLAAGAPHGGWTRPTAE